MARKKRRPDRKKASGGSGRQEPRLREAMDLLRRGRLSEADELLEALDRRGTPQLDLLTLRLEVALQLRDFRLYQHLAERLLLLRPGDPELLLRLASAYLSCARPALALRTFKAFL